MVDLKTRGVSQTEKGDSPLVDEKRLAAVLVTGQVNEFTAWFSWFPNAVGLKSFYGLVFMVPVRVDLKSFYGLVFKVPVRGWFGIP